MEKAAQEFVYAEKEWCVAARKLLRHLLVDRERGCICTNCLLDEAALLLKPNTELRDAPLTPPSQEIPPSA